MPLEQSIYLIGYRGTGKSTVARCLATQLGCDWIDSDDLVEKRSNKTIADMFAEEGEAAFRDAEYAVLAQLVAGDAKVVALGGGAVLRKESQTLLAGEIVVWLTATPSTLAERLAADQLSASRRPGLTDAGLLDEIEQVLAKRTPIYQQCATLTVDTQHRTPQDVADEICRRLTST